MLGGGSGGEASGLGDPAPAPAGGNGAPPLADVRGHTSGFVYLGEDGIAYQMLWEGTAGQRRPGKEGLTGWVAPIAASDAPRSRIWNRELERLARCRIHCCAKPGNCNLHGQAFSIGSTEPPALHGTVVALCAQDAVIDLAAYARTAPVRPAPAPAGGASAGAVLPAGGSDAPPPRWGPAPRVPPPPASHAPATGAPAPADGGGASASAIRSAARVFAAPRAHVSPLAFLIAGEECGFRPLLHFGCGPPVDLVAQLLPAQAADWPTRPAHFYAGWITGDAEQEKTEFHLGVAPGGTGAGHYGPLLPMPPRPRGTPHNNCGGWFCGEGPGWPCLDAAAQALAPEGFAPWPVLADGLCAFHSILFFNGKAGTKAAGDLRTVLATALALKEGNPFWEAAAQLAGEAWNDDPASAPAEGSAPPPPRAPTGEDEQPPALMWSGSDDGDDAWACISVSSSSDDDGEEVVADLEKDFAAFLGFQPEDPRWQTFRKDIANAVTPEQLTDACEKGHAIRVQKQSKGSALAPAGGSQDASAGGGPAEPNPGKRHSRQRRHVEATRHTLIQEGRAFLAWQRARVKKEHRTKEAGRQLSMRGATAYLRMHTGRHPERAERKRLKRAAWLALCEEGDPKHQDAAPNSRRRLPKPGRRLGRPHMAPALRLELLWWFCSVRGVVSRTSPRQLKRKAKFFQRRYAEAAVAKGVPVTLPDITGQWVRRFCWQYRISLRKPNKRWKVSRRVLIQRLRIMWVNVHRARRQIQLCFGYDPEIWNFDQKPLHRSEVGSKLRGALSFRGVKEVAIKELHDSTRDRFTANTMTKSRPPRRRGGESPRRPAAPRGFVQGRPRNPSRSPGRSRRLSRRPRARGVRRLVVRGHQLQRLVLPT